MRRFSAICLFWAGVGHRSLSEAARSAPETKRTT
jgi:hypothetical protein